MNNLELLKKESNNIQQTTTAIFTTVDIKDKQTALQALSFSGSFLTLTAWLRAFQFTKINEFVKVNEIVEKCDSINRSQIYIDIKIGKYLCIVNGKLVTVFDNESNSFNPAKYSNFCRFVEHIEKIAKTFFNDCSKRDRESYMKDNDCKTIDECILHYAKKVGLDLLINNNSLYDCDTKTLKLLLSGKELQATDEKATDEKATDEKATDEKATDEKATDEKSTDEKAKENDFAIEQFTKFIKKCKSNALIDIAKDFVKYVEKLNKK